MRPGNCLKKYEPSDNKKRIELREGQRIDKLKKKKELVLNSVKSCREEVSWKGPLDVVMKMSLIILVSAGPAGWNA